MSSPFRNFLKATTPDDNKRTVTGVAFRPQHRPTLTQQINQFIYLTVSAFFFFFVKLNPFMNLP